MPGRYPREEEEEEEEEEPACASIMANGGHEEDSDGFRAGREIGTAGTPSGPIPSRPGV
ncbi:hypothetical protein [Nocardia panacis]|uniref:hypothetical protein n=1 Tax=Nocardia panacis TaxID=2340916 RepID=UPI0013158FBC|nr:hypothetical protein [Nocardia panacis]